MKGMRSRSVIAMLSGIVLAAACTGDDDPEPGSEATTGTSRVKFDSRGGDSYAWSEIVTGQTECDEVTLEVNGEAVDIPVEVNGTVFSGEVPLRPGDNEVVAKCDGAGSEPVVFRQRLREGPTARIKVAVKGDTVVLDASASEPTKPDNSEITDYTWTPGPRTEGLRTQGKLTQAEGGTFETATGARVQLKAPEDDGEYFVSLEVADAEGRSDFSTTYFVVEDGRAREVDLMHEHPSWIDSAVVYAPIPALWGNGGPKTVEKQLPYLKKMGVDALWLWPPTSLRASGEEYAITDYFEVDPSWGPEQALKDMVAEAHLLGMYVLIDFVPNHMSSKSPYFKDAEDRGELSPYWNFFDRKDGEATHYFDWDHLPNLNLDDPEVQSMLMESTAHWVRDIGVDGFRMDVAWGVKRRKPEFWPKWRKEMKRVNPDVMLLAEASAVEPYWFSDGFDVAYDWTKSLGQWAWSSAFEFPQEAGLLLKTAITNGGKGYSPDAKILRFLNNNDTGVRFVDQHDAPTTRVAATLQFTLPGVPAMFAGDEIGASYEPYSNLTPIPWKDKRGLSPHYERLIELRHTVPALLSGDVDLLETNSSSVLAYVRPATEEGEAVLVVLNFGPKEWVELKSTPALEAALGGSGSMRDLLTGDSVNVGLGAGTASVSMGGVSSLVLVAGGN